MATVVKLRPLPKQENKAACQEWHVAFAQLEKYLKEQGCYFASYPNGNSGWENQQKYIKNIIAEYAVTQGYDFEWESGTPTMCSVATLTTAEG